MGLFDSLIDLFVPKIPIVHAVDVPPPVPVPVVTTNIDDLLKRADMTKLYPPFLKMYKQLLLNLRSRGVDFYCISGYRSFDEQALLYGQGRTDKTKPVVTNASPGKSAHNYGAAADSCRDADMTKAGLQMDWKLEDYAIYGIEASKLGLEAGYNWQKFKEGPHVQLPLGAHKLTWDTLAPVFLKQGGIPAVWALLDKHTWDGSTCPGCNVPAK